MGSKLPAPWRPVAVERPDWVVGTGIADALPLAAMSVNLPSARRASLAVAAVAAPFVLATSVSAAPASSAPDSDIPAGADCSWVDQDAIADLPLLEAADELSDISVFRAALDASGLATELDGQGPFTIFAPSNEAMNAIPQNVFDAMIADSALLTTIVGQHIVAGQSLSGADLAEAGTVETRSGTVTITGEAGALQVDGDDVLCGDIQTADATIFVIDGVLEPAGLGDSCAPGSSVPGSSTPGSSAPASSGPDNSTPGSSAPC